MQRAFHVVVLLLLLAITATTTRGPTLWAYGASGCFARQLGQQDLDGCLNLPDSTVAIQLSNLGSTTWYAFSGLWCTGSILANFTGAALQVGVSTSPACRSSPTCSLLGSNGRFTRRHQCGSVPTIKSVGTALVSSTPNHAVKGRSLHGRKTFPPIGTVGGSLR